MSSRHQRPRRNQTPANVLSPAESRRVEDAVDRALVFLASQQQPDGSFPTLPHGQPGVTSLCVLAYMAHGHLPGEGPHGQRLEAAADFIMSCQKENGLITLYGPDGPRITRDVSHEIGSAATYNHAIASLALSEMYGMSQTKRAARDAASDQQVARRRAGNAALAQGHARTTKAAGAMSMISTKAILICPSLDGT